MSVSYAFKAAKTSRGETAAESVEIQPDKATTPTIKDQHFHSSARTFASTKEQLDVLLDADESLTPLLAKNGSFEIFLNPTTAGDLELSTSDSANWKTLASESTRGAGGGGNGGGAAGSGGVWLGPDGGGGGGAGGEGGRPSNANGDGLNGLNGGGGAGGASTSSSGDTISGGSSVGAGGIPPLGNGNGSSGPLGTGTGGLVVPGAPGGLLIAGGLSGGALLNGVSEAPPSTAPEPTTLLLTALGLASLTASRFRNRVSR